MCTLSNYLAAERIFRDVPVDAGRDVISLVARDAEQRGVADRDNIESAIMERESYGTTGIGNGVAIPHGRLSDLDSIFLYVVTPRRPVDYRSIDGRDVGLFFVLLIPEHDNLLYLKLLAAISMICKNRSIADHVRDAGDTETIITVLGGDT